MTVSIHPSKRPTIANYYDVCWFGRDVGCIDTGRIDLRFFEFTGLGLPLGEAARKEIIAATDEFILLLNIKRRILK